MWPLSLLAFRRVALCLAADRKPKTVGHELLERFVSPKCLRHSSTSKPKWENTSTCHQRNLPKAEIKNGQHQWIEHSFRRHVKPKKQHEILHLGQVRRYFFLFSSRNSTICNCVSHADKDTKTATRWCRAVFCRCSGLQLNTRSARVL